MLPQNCWLVAHNLKLYGLIVIGLMTLNARRSHLTALLLNTFVYHIEIKEKDVNFYSIHDLRTKSRKILRMEMKPFSLTTVRFPNVALLLPPVNNSYRFMLSDEMNNRLREVYKYDWTDEEI